MPRFKICLDPGHGGADPGAVGYIVEKEYALDIATRVQKHLLNFGDAQVIMTRSADVFVSLEDRCRIANETSAVCFVSIHVNAGGGQGFESYVLPEAVRAKDLQSAIHNALSPMLAKCGIPLTAKCAEEVILPYTVSDHKLEEVFKDRGRKYARYYVLKYTKMPAVLLECGFVDNKNDAELLKKETFREELAVKIAEGVANFLGLKRKPRWDPQAEIDRLFQRGIINTLRQPSVLVQWGEFATVLNKICDRLDRLEAKK